MIMSEAFTKFDPAEYLTNEEQIESYLAVSKEAKNPVIYEKACSSRAIQEKVTFEKSRGKSCFTGSEE